MILHCFGWRSLQKGNRFNPYKEIDRIVGNFSTKFQNIDVVCMPKPGDFEYQDKKVKCYITGWGRRTESKFDH